MKKTFKSGFALLCALIMLVATAGSAFAAYQIPDADQLGSITIHKYVLGDAEEVGDANDGNEVDMTGKTPLKGVQFTITRVVADDEDEPITMDNYKAATGDIAYPDTKTTDENGTITWTDLAQGTYLIEESDNPIVTELSDPFLVVLPMTNTDGKTFNFDVHAYPKNRVEAKPTITKSVTQSGNKADTVGQTKGADFIIETSIPSDIHLCSEYVITDTIDSRLSVPTDATLTATKKDGTELKLIKDTDFSFATDGQNVTITLTQAGRTALEGYTALTTEYTCKLAAINTEISGQKIPNTATLSYTNSLGYPYTPESNEVEVHTASISLRKVNSADTSKALSGAQFKIFASEADAIAGTNPLKDVSGADYVVTTDSDGKAYFDGMTYGSKGDAYDSAATTDYWVVEVKAPTGYELYKAPIKVTASHASAGAAYTITNDVLFVLPGTGITSADLAQVGMIVFVAAAAGMVAWVVYRRKKHAA